jgi:Flp pilus assembly protein TadG
MAFVLRLTQRFRAFAPPEFWTKRNRKRRRFDVSGSAAVEFAILGPVFLLMMFGIFTYGGYFLTSHTVQQLTNDAARAAIAGLDNDERTWIASETVREGIASQRFMHGRLNGVDVVNERGAMVVTVTYDASNDLYWAARSIVPTPSPVISRTASIRLGGL